MTQSLPIIDADGHLIEPRGMWKKYIDEAYREEAPLVVRQNENIELFIVAGKPVSPYPVSSLGCAGMSDVRDWDDNHPGGGDPKERLKVMDAEGVDQVVLYPTLGLFIGGVQDAKLAAAIARAYNDWVTDFCSEAPDRLFAAAMLPMQDMELAAAEAKRVGARKCFRAAFIRPNPYAGRSLNTRAYDVVWKACVDNNWAVSIHEGVAGNMPTVGTDRFGDNLFYTHIIAHSLEMQLAVLALIGGGVMERFPTLRFAFLEAGGGWIVPWLDRMDNHYEGIFGQFVPWMKEKPSFYFERQCYISFDPGERTVASTAKLIGADRVIWGTDFPHPDTTYPGFIAELKESLTEFDSADQKKILSTNAATLYGL